MLRSGWVVWCGWRRFLGWSFCLPSVIFISILRSEISVLFIMSGCSWAVQCNQGCSPRTAALGVLSGIQIWCRFCPRQRGGCLSWNRAQSVHPRWAGFACDRRLHGSGGSPLAGELPGNWGRCRGSRAGCARCRGLSLPARGLPGILEQSKQTGWSISALAESPSGPGWRLSVNGDYLRACGAAPSDVAASDRAGVGNPQSHREEIPGRRGSSDAATLGGPRDAII